MLPSVVSTTELHNALLRLCSTSHSSSSTHTLRSPASRCSYCEQLPAIESAFIQSAPTISLSSQNPPESKAHLPFRRLACHPLHAPTVATLPLPTRFPSCHQPAHPQIAYLPPRSAAVVTAEKSLLSTRISCVVVTLDASSPAPSIAGRSTSRGPEHLRHRRPYH